MNAEATPTRDELAATYLQQMQALAREISVATEAVAGNQLTRLQESVANQEMICARLEAIANTVSAEFLKSGPTLVPCIDNSIELKIRAARAAILDLNLKYAALLKHSGRTIALLSALCKSRTGQFQEAHGPRLKVQTWSCEI